MAEMEKPTLTTLPAEIRSTPFEPYPLPINELPRTRVHLSLLRVNRQIHMEAREIVVKQNRLIHVITNKAEVFKATCLSHYVIPLATALIPEDTSSLRSIILCKLYVMRVTIWDELPECQMEIANVAHLILSADLHLEWLCQAISEGDVNYQWHRVTRQTLVRVELLNLFGIKAPLAKTDHGSVDIEESSSIIPDGLENLHIRDEPDRLETSLLLPIRTDWWGIKNFVLDGTASPTTKDEIEGIVRADREESTEAFIASIRAMKDSMLSQVELNFPEQVLQLGEKAFRSVSMFRWVNTNHPTLDNSYIQTVSINEAIEIARLMCTVNTIRATASVKLARKYIALPAGLEKEDNLTHHFALLGYSACTAAILEDRQEYAYPAGSGCCDDLSYMTVDALLLEGELALKLIKNFEFIRQEIDRAKMFYDLFLTRSLFRGHEILKTRIEYLNQALLDRMTDGAKGRDRSY